jgi:hypothetical protein
MDGERSGLVTRTLREWTQFAILLFATGWGVYTFVYKETILPSRRPATLAVSTSLEEVGRTEKKALIRLRVHAVNRTDRKIYVPALWYTIQGYRLTEQTGAADEFRAQIEYAPQAEIHGRYSTVADADVVAVGTILNRVTDYYEPTDETSNEVLFEVPLDRYHALRVHAQFFLTRQTDGLSLNGWQVSESGELNPQLMLTNRPYDPGFNAQHHAWALSSGAGFNWCSATLPLWPKPALPADPAASAEPRISSLP